MDRDFTVSLTSGMVGMDLGLSDDRFDDLTLREMEDIRMKMKLILNNLDKKIGEYYRG